MITRRSIIGSAGLSIASGALVELYGKAVTLSEHARGRTFNDETSLVQDAIDTAIAARRPLIIDIATRVSSLAIRKATGLFVLQSAPIVGLTTGTYPALLAIEDTSDLTWAGRLWLSCQWNAGYKSAVAITSRAGTICSNINIHDWAITGARCAFKFGMPDIPTSAVSEISVGGGFSYGCPSVVQAFGGETVVSFIGSNLIANHLGGDGDWHRLPSDTVIIVGAHLSIMGGEVQHNASSAGAAFAMQAENQTSFGSVVVMGAAVESAGPLLVIRDTPGTSSTLDGRAFFEGCIGYHSQRDIPFIQVGRQFSGRVTVGDGCWFRAGARRTAPIVKNDGNASLQVSQFAFDRLFHPR